MVTACRGAIVVVLLFGLVILAQTEPANDPGILLKRQNIDPTPTGVMAFLRGHIVDVAQQKQVAQWIVQLGHDDFLKREEASENLGRAGLTALKPLREASASKDPEVQIRVSELLAKIEKPEAIEQREQLMTAALLWLERERPAGAATLLVDVLPHLPESAQESAMRALWRTARSEDGERLRVAFKGGPDLVRAAVLPALEVAEGSKADPVLVEALGDTNPAIRLAAARGLLDRQRAKALPVLVALLTVADANARTQAAWILQQLSGVPTPNREVPVWTVAVERWKAWAGSPEAAQAKPLGATRYRIERYGLLFAEAFDQEAKAITDAYGAWRYFTNVRGKATVSAGRLRLDGQHPEGDQRLILTAQKLLGTPTFPRTFQVKALLGGEADSPGGWHIGVTVGKVRLLFHPEVHQGAFRVERVTDNFYLHQNENMPFTPAANTLHEMTINVQQNADQSVRLEVVVADGKKQGRDYRKTVTIPAKDIGPLSEVSLDRSGRTGGAGLFGAMRIQQGE